MQFVDKFSVNSPIGNNVMVQFVDEFTNSSRQFVREFVSGVNDPSCKLQLLLTVCIAQFHFVTRTLNPSTGGITVSRVAAALHSTRRDYVPYAAVKSPSAAHSDGVAFSFAAASFPFVLS